MDMLHVDKFDGSFLLSCDELALVDDGFVGFVEKFYCHNILVCLGCYKFWRGLGWRGCGCWIFIYHGLVFWFVYICINKLFKYIIT